MKIGIIGGSGWIGSSLGRAAIETGYIKPEDLIILNRAGSTSTYFGHPVQWARSAQDLVSRADVIVISVRPQDWSALALNSMGKLTISVMAGVPLRALPPRTLRALPNAAAELRQSFTPWFGPDLTAADREVATGLLSTIGTCAELSSEHQLDLMTATSGAGPAYTALMADAVITYLTANGVPQTIAEQAAEAMICAAAPLLAGKMPEAAAMVQRFIDYKGTTAAGLNTALQNGFATALQTGLAAATARAKEMSEGF